MLRTLATIVLAAFAPPAVGAEAGDCYASWSVAAPVVRQEGLTTVEALSRAAQSKLSGDIVKTTLCKENGDFVYRLLIRGPHGQLSKKTVDARMPFGR